VRRVRIRLELRTKIKVLSISSVETRVPGEKSLRGKREDRDLKAFWELIRNYIMRYKEHHYVKA